MTRCWGRAESALAGGTLPCRAGRIRPMTAIFWASDDQWESDGQPSIWGVPYLLIFQTYPFVRTTSRRRWDRSDRQGLGNGNGQCWISFHDGLYLQVRELQKARTTTTTATATATTTTGTGTGTRTTTNNKQQTTSNKQQLRMGTIPQCTIISPCK